MGKNKKESNPNSRFDAAGWGFWTCLFVLFAIPFTYVSWHYRAKDSSFYTSLIFGFVAPAIASGLVSWTVNAFLQRKAKRQRIETRKKAKKRR